LQNKGFIAVVFTQIHEDPAQIIPDTYVDICALRLPSNNSPANLRLFRLLEELYLNGQILR
ncbi:MAG: hypothetical protein Q4E62_01935, partial [Sutterellaceae bacterium]|nr:hypothetical protein [Sutterellaceae bacterium]